jgi:hypothetical protein
MYNAHIESLFFKNLKILLPDLIKLFKLQFVQRFIYGYLPPLLSKMWTTNGDRRNQEQIVEGARFWNNSDLYVPLVKYNYLDNSLIFGFPRLWNEFDDSSTKLIHSKTEFNSKLKNYFLETLADNYVCNRLLCPHCHLN